MAWWLEWLKAWWSIAAPEFVVVSRIYQDLWRSHLMKMAVCMLISDNHINLMWETQQWTNHLGKVEIPIKMVMDSPGGTRFGVLGISHGHEMSLAAWPTMRKSRNPPVYLLNRIFACFTTFFFEWDNMGHMGHMPHFWSCASRFYFKLSTPNARRIFGQFLILVVSSVRKISGGRIEGISNSDLEFWPCNGPPKICEVASDLWSDNLPVNLPIISVNQFEDV
jgi:hypothetical protein